LRFDYLHGNLTLLAIFKFA